MKPNPKALKSPQSRPGHPTAPRPAPPGPDRCQSGPLRTSPFDPCSRPEEGALRSTTSRWSPGHVVDLRGLRSAQCLPVVPKPNRRHVFGRSARIGRTGHWTRSVLTERFVGVAKRPGVDAFGRRTRVKDCQRTRSKKLLGAPGIATKGKDAASLLGRGEQSGVFLEDEQMDQKNMTNVYDGDDGDTLTGKTARLHGVFFSSVGGISRPCGIPPASTLFHQRTQSCHILPFFCFKCMDEISCGLSRSCWSCMEPFSLNRAAKSLSGATVAGSADQAPGCVHTHQPNWIGLDWPNGRPAQKRTSLDVERGFSML